MDLRAYFLTIAETYDYEAGMSSPAQMLLRRAPTELQEHVPAGFRVIGSGGRGGPTFTPWIGFFDPDETESPQEGIYVVYIFSSDMSRLTLTLNQGEERLRQAHGDQRARIMLHDDAARIREGFRPDEIGDLDIELDLGPRLGARQRAYASANIVAKSYPLISLPPERDLRRDLERFVGLYGTAIATRDELLLREPGVVASSAAKRYTGPPDDPLAGFRPKDDSDYVAQLSGRRIVKTRRHETLLRDFAEWTVATGFRASDEHPRDMVLRRNDEEFLIEAKVIRRGNATFAVREAIGQLFTYSHFLYGSEDQPTRVALFSEPIGKAYVALLASLDIIPVWHEAGRWIGSNDAVIAGLAQAT